MLNFRRVFLLLVLLQYFIIELLYLVFHILVNKQKQPFIVSTIDLMFFAIKKHIIWLVVKLSQISSFQSLYKLSLIFQVFVILKSQQALHFLQFQQFYLFSSFYWHCNKIIKMFLGALAEPKKNIYRSIKYRSVSSDLRPNKIKLQASLLSQYQNRKSELRKKYFKSSTHKLTTSHQNIKNINKSLTESLDKIHFDTKIGQSLAINPEDSSFKGFQHSTYLETFEETMELSHKVERNNIKMGPLTQKIKTLKEKSRISRINLPNLIEFEHSQFSILDPINNSIDFVVDRIKQLKEKSAENPIQHSKIHHQIISFEEKMSQQLEEFRVQFRRTLKGLSFKLSQNSVLHQSNVMSAKRQLKQLQNWLPEFKNSFKGSQQWQINLQIQIFEQKPYELRVIQQKLSLQERMASTFEYI